MFVLSTKMFDYLTYLLYLRLKMFTLGQKIVKIRQLKGLSQIEMSRMLGLKAQALGRYEKDNVKPSFDFVVKLTDMFRDVNPAWLLTDQEPILLDDSPSQKEQDSISESENRSNIDVDSIFDLKVENAVLKKDNDRLRNENLKLLERTEFLIGESAVLKHELEVYRSGHDTVKGATA